MSESKKQGSVFGGVLLIAGCCIGAGMLGLPVISAAAGFVPSLVIFVLAWGFMFTTGLLLLEVNLWCSREDGIISMAGKTLGKAGQAVAWVLFLFLFYSLMVAYVSGSGALTSDFFHATQGIDVPKWAGSLGFVFLFGALIYLGTGTVDKFNRFLMIGLAVAYCVLILMGIWSVKPDNLQYANWEATVFVVPVMVISFGYHNLVPSMKTYLGGDRKRICKAILLGSLLPLAIYLLWQLLIMGIVPLQMFKNALDNEQLATQALVNAVGISWLAIAAEYFGFFSIVTSFLAVALSLADFLADGFGIEKTPLGKIALCAMTLLPPFFFSLWYPSIFLTALNYAGAFGAVILFGILPALMVWNGRYVQKIKQPHLVYGGKATLIVILLFSVAVVSLKLAESLDWIHITRYYDPSN